MQKTEKLAKEEVFGWLLEKIQKKVGYAISLESAAAKSVSDLGLDSVELIEMVSDFETKFDCRIITEQLLEKESLSELGESMYQAASGSSS